MSDWSSNNRAHALLWYSLRVLDQLDTDFKGAGELRVADLTFWNPLDSEDARRERARTLAVMLENNFRMIYRAAYEDGVDHPAAIDALFGALRVGETTLPELGAVTDATYSFIGEVTHE